MLKKNSLSISLILIAELQFNDIYSIILSLFNGLRNGNRVNPFIWSNFKKEINFCHSN